MTRWVVLPFAALSTLSAGCKLSEVVTGPPGEFTVIEQMVLNTGAPVQMLVLDASDRGTSNYALSPATVRLTHLNPDASCARPTVTLTEASDSIIYGRDVERRRVYQTRELCARRELWREGGVIATCKLNETQNHRTG